MTLISWLKNANSVWQAIGAAGGLFALGFGAGLYVSSSMENLERYKENLQMEQNFKLQLDQKDAEIHQLRKENEEQAYSLHATINELKQQIKEGGQNEK